MRREGRVLEFSKVREKGFYKGRLSRDWIMMVSVFSVRCQGICTANRGNIPPAISDTGFLSATSGMYGMMIRKILARCTDGKIAAVGVIYFLSVCVCVGGREREIGRRGERVVR